MGFKEARVKLRGPVGGEGFRNPVSLPYVSSAIGCSGLPGVMGKGFWDNGEGRILKFVFHHSEVSGFFPSNQSPRANAQPEIAMSRPLMEFTHGEIIAKNGEDRGVGGGARR